MITLLNISHIRAHKSVKNSENFSNNAYICNKIIKRRKTRDERREIFFEKLMKLGNLTTFSLDSLNYLNSAFSNASNASNVLNVPKLKL